jgi:Galactose-3-O-sulfotransferase
MLRQYGLPFSDKWGYSPGSGMTVQFFDNRDIERLHVEGLLEFVDDDRAGRCAILATSKEKNVFSPPWSAETGRRDEGTRRLAAGYGSRFEESSSAKMLAARSAIVAALTPEPRRPRKVLRQYALPFSDKWGYSPGPRMVVQFFDNRDIERLYVEGLLEFVDDEAGGRCAILAPLKKDASLPLLSAEIHRRDEEIRRLTVSYGSTFEELIAAGKAGGGEVYTFDELSKSASSLPTVPPLVFIHVPKAGGTTINHILMKNYRWRLDSYGPDFFPRYFPDEFISLVEPPLQDDTRRPVFFTGHIDIANDVFRYMPVRYVAITMLREPVERAVSLYRFHSTLPTPLGDDLRSGKVRAAGFYREFQKTHPPQYELFAPGSSHEQGRIKKALHNLENKISIFGLQTRFDEFAMLLVHMLGLSDVTYAPLNVTPEAAAQVSAEDRAELRDALADDIAFYEGAARLYQERSAKLEPPLKELVEQFRRTKSQLLSDRKALPHHPWRALLRLMLNLPVKCDAPNRCFGCAAEIPNAMSARPCETCR